MSRRVRRLTAAVAVLATLATGACSEVTPTGLSKNAPNRQLVVATNERVRSTDPATATDAGSVAFVYNVYQRLLAAGPATGLLKADAAGECMFLDATTYSCSLRRNVYFSNGKRVSAIDAKKSIERAMKMNAPGTSVPLLSSLKRIDVVDEFRVDFKLQHEDTQFAFALASPAASIVDTEFYGPTEWPIDRLPVGSGPYMVSGGAPEVTSATPAPDAESGETPKEPPVQAPPMIQGRNPDEWRLARYPRYSGSTVGAVPDILVRSYPNWSGIEQDMLAGRVDVMWHGAPEPVLDRLLSEARDGEKRTDTGFAPMTVPGARVQRLEWNPASARRSDEALRRYVVDATAGMRTLDSLVPPSIPGHTTAFPVGRRNAAYAGQGELTLSFESRLPDQADLAERVKQALEAGGSVRVRLAPDSTDADLALVERRPWTDTPSAWLQTWLDHPLPGTEAELTQLDTRFRSTPDLEVSRRAIADLQRRAADQATVVPLTQRDDYLWTAPEITVGTKQQQQTQRLFAAGSHLALWSLTW